MAFTLDISTDYTIFDNTITVQYSRRLTDDTFAAAIDVLALKRQDNKNSKEINSVEYNFHNCIWEVWPQTAIASFIPKRGDKFSATGISGTKIWVVEGVDYSDFTTRYRLRCYQEGMGA